MITRLIAYLKKIFQSNLYIRAIVFSILFFFFLKLITTLLILVLGYIYPDILPPDNHISVNQYSHLEQEGWFAKLFIAPWYRWDTVHYIDIAIYGYSNSNIVSVWPPLYPLLIKFCTILSIDYTFSSLIVSNLSTLVSYFLLYLLSSHEWDENIARETLFFLTIFPSAFFLIAGYTESLFLALSIGYFLAIKNKNWITAGLLGSATILTRLQGILLIIPLFWMFLEKFLVKRHNPRNYYCLQTILIMLFTFIGYFLYIHFGLGYAWPWLTLNTNWQQHLAWPWEGLLGNLQMLLGISELKSNSYVSTFYDLFLVSFSLLVLLIARNKVKAIYLIYSTVMIFVVLIITNEQNFLESTSRYLLVIFPIFIALVVSVGKPLKLIWSIFSFISQCLLLVIFYLWGWVA